VCLTLCLGVFVPLCSYGAKENGTIPPPIKNFKEDRHTLAVGVLPLLSLYLSPASERLLSRGGPMISCWGFPPAFLISVMEALK
jgi:hypothetical protein